MRVFVIVLVCLGVLAAGVVGQTLSLPLQSSSLILLGLAAVLYGLAGVLVPGRRAGGDAGGYAGWLLLPVAAGLVYFLGRAVFSTVWDLALEDLFLIFAAGIVYLLVVGLGVAVQRSLACAVLVLLVLHLGSALMQMAGGDGYSLAMVLSGAARSEGNVVTGMYGYRGSFANFGGIAGFLALSLGVWGRFRMPWRVLLVLLGVLALGVACVAKSRSAVIAFGVGGGVWLVLLWMSVQMHQKPYRSMVRTGVLLVACLGIIVGSVAGVWVFQERAQHTAKGADVMFDSDVRLAFWSMAAEQFADYPLVGAGSRSFSYQSFYYWSPNLDTGEANPEFVHNEYLQVLADYGLMGFLLVVAVLGGHVLLGSIRVRRLASMLSVDEIRRGNHEVALLMAGMAGMVIMAVHVMFDFRTHLLPNLLLLTCCAAWVLPVSCKAAGGMVKHRVLAALVFCLGLGAVGFGGQQLWAGMPLIQNKMAKEDGTWDPGSVPRGVWIPALEEAVGRQPNFRRHLKLGTLCRLEGDACAGEERENWYRKAVAEYEKAATRHPYESVSRLNLASLHTCLQEYPEADSYFQQADKLASSRERWFRIHTKWADMQRRWAGWLWMSGDRKQAAEHYRKALQILKDAEVKSGDNAEMRLMVVIELVRMLDLDNNFDESDELLNWLEESLPLYIINSRQKNIRREMGDHYMRKGKHFWYDRKPLEAKSAFEKAERSYRIHQVVLKKRPDPQWKKSYEEVKGILRFFKVTGVGEGREKAENR